MADMFYIYMEPESGSGEETGLLENKCAVVI